MKSTNTSPTLRLVAVSDVSKPQRRPLTSFALRDADVILDDLLSMFSEFAVLLRTDYAITVDGVTYVLPASQGSAAHG